MRPEEIAAFTDQLGLLLETDYPLAEGLTKFSHEIKSESFKAAVERVSKGLAEGASLAEALEREEDAFSPEFVGLIRAGEMSGALPDVLEVALEHETFMSKLEKRLSGALFYPIALFIWTLICFSAIARYTIPMMEEFYDALGGAAPPGFRTMAAVFHGPAGSALVAWTVLSLILFWWIKNRVGMATLAGHVPGIGRLVADVYSARLAKSLGLLLAAGVAPDAALASVAAATGDRGTRVRLLKASRRAGEGESLSKALSANGLGGPELFELAEIGEESGALPGMLSNAGGLFRAEAESRLEVVARLVGSTLLLALGAWIVVLMSGWLNAYFNLSSLGQYY